MKLCGLQCEDDLRGVEKITEYDQDMLIKI